MKRYIDNGYIAQTACGLVQGRAGAPGITEFRGIRYATAERFARPELVTHWDGIYNATEFGSACLQPRTFFPENSFYAHEFREGSVFTYSEDCLFLNIWVPDGAECAPVLFYIHGGAFTSGCGHEKHFDPAAWCRKGVIAVTCNYRLGVLGFSNFEQARTADTCGNYGLFDQIAALTWVKDNIANFGGDPNRVTIMGQSAGAMSVQQLSLSPLACDLFAGAVMLSGGGLTPAFAPVPAQDTFAEWNAFAASLGATSLEDLRAIPAEELVKAYTQASQEKRAPQSRPIIDGELVTTSNQETAHADGAHPIPYIIGSTSEDMVRANLQKAVDEWAAIQHEQSMPPVYGYFFSRQLPGDDKGAWHSSDLWYFFGSLHNSWRPMEAWDDTLSEAMVTYLTDFAWSGDPNHSGTQKPWLPLTPGQNQRMHFGNHDYGMETVDMSKLEIAQAAVSDFLF